MRCVNGHDVGPGESSCSLCGGAIDASARDKVLIRKRAAIIAGVAVVCMLAVAGITYAVTSTGSGRDNQVSDTSTPSDTPSATAQAGVGSWMCRFQDGSALFLQWPTGDGTITGSYEEATLSGTPPSQQVSTDNGTFSGTETGTAITLNIFNENVYGTLTNGQLTVNLPQQDGTIATEPCMSSSPDQWNQQIASLGGQASTGNQSAAAQQAAQQGAQRATNEAGSLDSAISQLGSDAQSLETDKSLGTDVDQMKNDIAAEQKDWTAEQQDQCSNISGDASTVEGDDSTVQGDASTIAGDITTLSNSIQALQQEISTVRSDLQTYTSDPARTGAPPDPTSNISAGVKAINDAKSAIKWANQQASSLQSQADQVSATANNYATAHSC